MSARVELDRVTVRYGAMRAVDAVSLTIEAGEFFSILGPSGCGKTTLLRTVAGFAEPASGMVRIGGQDMRGIGPERRPTAMIFQSLALFPLMSVAENVGYGLRLRGIGRRERRERVAQLLATVALEGYEAKRVDALSGGQRQRVAIARALAVEPQVLLLDEPLSALDLKLRQRMREELRAIQRRVGLTFLYITHDQGEALAMSDRVAVMNAGRIEQIGDARTVYDAPETAFVAAFVGEANALPGRVESALGDLACVATPLGRLLGRNPRRLAPGAAATVFVRPERVRITAGNDAADAPENMVNAAASERTYEGSLTHVAFHAGAVRLTATVPARDAERLPPAGVPVRLGFSAADAVALPP